MDYATRVGVGNVASIKHPGGFCDLFFEGAALRSLSTCADGLVLLLEYFEVAFCPWQVPGFDLRASTASFQTLFATGLGLPVDDK